jgi:hypothetical protein
MHGHDLNGVRRIVQEKHIFAADILIIMNMKTTMMIEPCCCERQLPQLLKEANGMTMMFTNGDVTLDHFFRSVSSLAGTRHKMMLVMAEPDVQVMRWLRYWLQRGWTTGVQLTTKTDCKELVQTELEGLTERISLAIDDTLQSELVSFEGDGGTVVVAGRMLSEMAAGLTTYACYSGKGRGIVAQLLEAVEARHNARRKGQGSGSEEKGAREKVNVKGEKGNVKGER